MSPVLFPLSECEVEDLVIPALDLADTHRSTTDQQGRGPWIPDTRGCQPSPRLFTPRLLYEKEIRFSLV